MDEWIDWSAATETVMSSQHPGISEAGIKVAHHIDETMDTQRTTVEMRAENDQVMLEQNAVTHQTELTSIEVARHQVVGVVVSNHVRMNDVTSAQMEITTVIRMTHVPPTTTVELRPMPVV